MPEISPRTRRAGAGAYRACAVATALALGLTACSGGGGGERAENVELTVMAAASLTDVFTEIAESFEEEHPEVTVVLNFAGSGELAQQITSGAPADVFASADTTTMERVVEAGDLDADWAAEHGEEGLVFATNTLMIAVPPGNPAGVSSLHDLTSEDVSTAFCADEVPCGTATGIALEAAGLEVAPVTLEEDVRAVLTKVELGEVDAGLVYETDVISAGDRVEGIGFPEAEEAVNEYPIGVLANSEAPERAAAWVDFVTGQGAPVMREAGFGTP